MQTFDMSLGEENEVSDTLRVSAYPTRNRTCVLHRCTCFKGSDEMHSNIYQRGHAIEAFLLIQAVTTHRQMTPRVRTFSHKSA